MNLTGARRGRSRGGAGDAAGVEGTIDRRSVARRRIARRRAALRRAEFVAGVLDDAVRIPGTTVRIGLDPVLDLVPVVGDAAGSAISLYVVFEAARAGVPKRTLARMLTRVGVDTVLGGVPIAGPVFDAAWKANRRNVETLRRHVDDARS